MFQAVGHYVAASFTWICVSVTYAYASYNLSQDHWVVRKCPETRIAVGGCNTTTGWVNRPA
jgi:hypothetical protein